ncbi:hypothetical protein CSOJ01_16008 [Colletotrichum sojae]|uniref:DUF6594 domain-containing protein n=1 Tax=Colletotrichum sojae TaxID=2175907 RepID=A0A8H6ILR0_9PEZI|nr:hypothetical protein CSOJ01_16008 [Colletotrichum sojae]
MIRSGTGMRDPKVGYAAVAEWMWMARDVDNETLIYRRFDELSTRFILELQSELLELEEKLQKLDKEDGDPDEDLDWVDVVRTRELMDKWADSVNLNGSSQNQEFCSKAKIRMDMNARIRLKLKEYHETLLLQSEIAKLKRPTKRVFKAFEAWFSKPPKLGGRAKRVLESPQDLVPLNPSQETDYLSELLRRHWPAEKESFAAGTINLGRYEEKSISIAVAVVSIIIAAALLIGSIVGLYFAKNDITKLGLITLFTTMFALSVGLMTNSRRAEILAGTAAYAAVLVVFVSGDLSSSQGS